MVHLLSNDLLTIRTGFGWWSLLSAWPLPPGTPILPHLHHHLVGDTKRPSSSLVLEVTTNKVAFLFLAFSFPRFLLIWITEHLSGFLEEIIRYYQAPWESSIISAWCPGSEQTKLCSWLQIQTIKVVSEVRESSVDLGSKLARLIRASLSHSRKAVGLPLLPELLQKVWNHSRV